MLENIKTRSISSVRDTLSSQHHSKDFIFARSEYLRIRTQIVSLIFIILTPFWALFDWFLLPTQSLPLVLPARGMMLMGLVFILFASSRSWLSTKFNFLLSSLVFILPALFYGAVLISLPTAVFNPLIGYSFLPFLLVVTLGIFPFTLVESLGLGVGLILLQLFAGAVMSSAFSAQSLQNLWLLSALLTIVMANNHFHLSLLLRLYRQATHDPLTGLLNRVALVRYTEHLEQLEQRPSTAIILLDLDYFKKINDRYGHSVGDQVLRLFATLLKNESNPNEIIYRYGGEEFLIIRTYTNPTEALKRAEQIRLSTQQLKPHTLDKTIFAITVSQGVSMLRPKESIQEAIVRADERLYLAKKKGRNCVVAKN